MPTEADVQRHRDAKYPKLQPDETIVGFFDRMRTVQPEHDPHFAFERAQMAAADRIVQAIHGLAARIDAKGT